MTITQPSRDILPTLVQWAAARDPIRAMLLTSTRATPGAPVDILSDYDVILVMQDIEPFVAERAWLDEFGEVLVAYWDPIHPNPDFGLEQCGNVVQYADGLKIDFTLWPVALFERIVAAPALDAELDAGYRVLLDKDHLTDALRAPTFTAYVPRPPSLEAYQTWINDFMSDAPYVAKCLWRDDLLPAKWCLDEDMKLKYLRQMLEWRVEIDRGWSVPVGYLGKGLKKRLPPDLWAQVEGTFAGASIADNWEALRQTMALFRWVAIEVGAALGYAYPDDLHRRVCAYVEQIAQEAGKSGHLAVRPQSPAQSLLPPGRRP
jgi:aminoglycoside 6-adenylyltransferase